MKRLLPILVCTIALSCSAAARTDSPAAGEAHGIATDGGSLDRILFLMEEKGKKLETLTADFTQVKRFSLFGDEHRSRGKIYYKKGGKMAWHYAPPDSNEVYLNDGVAWTYIPDIKQIQKIDLGREYKISTLLIGFGVPAPELKKNFSISLVEEGDDGPFVLDFVPKNREIAAVLERIRVWLDREKMVPVRTEQLERSKDTTVFEFSGIVLNSPLEDGFFEFTVPRGVEVVDYSKP